MLPLTAYLWGCSVQLEMAGSYASMAEIMHLVPKLVGLYYSEKVKCSFKIPVKQTAHI